MGKSLSHLSPEATQDTNTADVLTSILTIDPTDGVYLQLHNRVSAGKAVGLPLIMDLRDGTDTAIDVDSLLLLRVERPEDDEPTAVSVAENNLAAWNDLTTAEQRDEDNIDAVKVELKSENVNVRDKDTLTIAINSPDVVDWANSELFFVREGVDEFPID